MDDIASLVAKADLPSIAASFTEVKKRGHEYVARCIFHSPDNNPSLYIYNKGQKWNYTCFSCGAQGDALDWIEFAENLDTKDALKRLNGGAIEWKPISPIRREATKPPPERITSKPPAGASVPNMATRDLGEPVKTWAYRDTDGEALGYVARYEKEGRKEIRCWSWGARGDAAPDWGCGHFGFPRPIYALDVLAANPGRTVLVVEGEKAAEAAQRLLPSYVATTWPAGAQSWHRADWKPIAGRKVLLWPDNDEPGIEAMHKLAAILADPKGLGCAVRIIDPAGMADGFDAADWTGTTEELIAWAKPRASDYTAPAALHKNPAPQAEAATSSAALPDPNRTPEAAGPVQDDASPPPVGDTDFPPEARKSRPRKPRRHLAVVHGNTAPAPDPDAEPLPASMSEDAIADAFAEENAQDWRYVAQWGHWMHWDGDVWARDRKELIDRLAVEMCRKACYWSEAAEMSKDQKRRLGQRKTAGAVRDLARHDRRIAASADGWDSDPLLIGVPGGVFDVRLGKIIEGEREQYVTRRTAFAPAPGEPKRWLSHLSRMMAGDQAMINFLQLYAGYCATGDVSEQCFIFLYGMGQTGKGTFLLTLAEILGSYAAQSSASTFMSQNQEKHSSEIARLAGCRLVVIDETDGSARWNEERIKRMTGGGKITAALKYQDETDISVTWKLAFAGNHKPALRGVGKEMQRRIRLVKCNESIPDEVVDRRFRERMIAEEGPQILNWILQGAMLWHESGLTLPENVSEATREYLESEDTLGDWLGENCGSGGDTKRPEAFKDYATWAEARGDRAWSNRAWWAAMQDRGYNAKKINGVWFVIGLSLKNQAPATPSRSY